MADLLGKTCVVTGAGSGIGRIIAQVLADAGGRVAVLDRNLDGARETAAQLVASSATAIAIECDVADEGSVRAACASVQAEFGDADILVNNAAITGSGPLASFPLAEWSRLISVNLLGYFLCAQAFGQAMLARGSGAIVHVSSIAGDIPTPNLGAYGVCKAGVTMLSRQLAMEWGPSGVRSNSVHPGLIYTPLTVPLYEKPGARENRTNAIPLRRIGEPNDIAQAVLYLAGPNASYVNGTQIVVDGGLSDNLFKLIPGYGA